MIHPVFRLAAAQPLWLAGHAAAYASLVSEELVLSGQSLQRRLTLQLAGGASLAVAFVLAGVALMLWFTLPREGAGMVPVLLITPAVPAGLGFWCLWAASRPVSRKAFARLREQLGLDASLLRTPDLP
jgi:DNA-binding transcriptional LysR family regulator